MKKQLLFLLLLMSSTQVFGAGNQTLESELPQVLHIEKIIIEGQEYDKDDEITNSHVTTIKPIGNDNYEISLTPFIVRIQTNLGDAIEVHADFEECCSCDSKYSLNKADLMVSPSSLIVSNPYNMIETDFFTPKVIAHKDTVLTKYRGKLIITLGRV